MAADCYLCKHKDELGDALKDGDHNPVGVCFRCRVLACDGHGERRANRFYCYLCIAVTACKIGPQKTADTWPGFAQKVRDSLKLSKEQFSGMKPDDAARRIRKVALGRFAKT